MQQIVALDGIDATDIHRTKHKFLLLSHKILATFFHLAQFNPTWHTLPNTLDHRFGGVISQLLQLLHSVEVKQSNVREMKIYQDTFLFRNLIVGIVHDQFFEQSHRTRRVLGVKGRIVTHRTTNNKVRMEILLHHIHRKIIVNATIQHQQSVHLYRSENKRERHGCTHGVAQISIPMDISTFMRHVGRHAAEWNKQTVKVSPAGSIGLGE